MAGEKGGKGPGPEREPAAQRHASIDSLLNVGPGLSPEARGHIGSLARALEPYEDFAKTFGKGPIEDKIALIEILDQQHVISPEFLNEFGKVGRLIDLMNVRAERQLHAAVTTHTKNGEPTSEDGARAIRKAQEEHRRIVREVERTTGSILSRFDKDQRPLAKAVMTEALTMSFVRSLERNILRQGAKKVMADYAPDGLTMEDNERFHGQRHLAWIRHAAGAGKLKLGEYKEKPDDFTVEEKLKLLRDAEFMPAAPMAFQLPFGSPSTGPATLILSVSESNNAFTIANVVVRLGNERVACSLSRLTGQLHPTGGMFFTLEDEFRFAGAQRYYAFLRETIIRTLFVAWERGKLTEQTYLEIDPETDKEAAVDVPVEEHAPITDSTIPEVQPQTPVIEESVSTNVSVPERKRRFATGRISWRRVMTTLERCGVQIDMGHAHPKLKYEGRTTRYLNSHEKDPRHSREQLFNALADLGISRETFFEKLR